MEPSMPEAKFLDESGIAQLLGMRREYVRDRLVKRSDFPRPAIAISQKIRRWTTEDVQRWIERKREENLR